MVNCVRRILTRDSLLLHEAFCVDMVVRGWGGKSVKVLRCYSTFHSVLGYFWGGVDDVGYEKRRQAEVGWGCGGSE